MEGLQAQEEQLRQESEVAENRRKINAALFADMDRMQGDADARCSSSSNSLQPQPASSLPSTGGQPRTTVYPGPSSRVNSSAAAYVPPGWSGPVPLAANDNEREDSVVEVAGIPLPSCGCGILQGRVPATSQLLDMLGLRAPSADSFDDFFRKWFEDEFFPTLNNKLKTELVHRAKSKSFLSGLSSQFKKWALANTDERLQADVWYTYFMQHSPPQFQTVGVLLQASVNLGSAAQPCLVTFWGLPDAHGDHWTLPPWSSYDVEMSAILDELDERGGMAALVSASA